MIHENMRCLPRLPIIISLVILFSAVSMGGHALAVGPNLIGNADLETAGASGPADWIKGRWGINTAVFQYPVTGAGGGKAAKVSITSYSSGDAKWAPNAVAVAPGVEYEFSDSYISNVNSFITVDFKLSNGSHIYKDIANPGPRSSFGPVSAVFAAPAGAETAMIFHLIKNVGNLTVDNYSLTDVSGVPTPTPTPTPAPNPGNLIQNPSFESTNSSGLPINWFKGRWGTNTANFIFPVAGFDGANAAEINISSYSTGDAKWYFGDVQVTPGTTYEFSDFYRASTGTVVTARFNTNGTFSYRDIGFPGASADWKNFKTLFVVPSGATSLTIFHLIKGVGSLAVDNYSLRVADTQLQGLISLNFDDGHRDVYDLAVPILDAAGFKSTQYIVPGYWGFPSYITASETLNLQSRGHEIGAHTRHHVDLTAISAEDANKEIAGSRDDLLSIGISEVKTFAYPFGSYNDQVIQMVKDAGFATARSTNGGFNIKGLPNRYTLNRQGVNSNTTFAVVKGWIDQAMANKTWLVLVFHHVNSDGDGAPFQTTPAILQQIVDYLAEQNITPVTMKQAEALMK